MQDLLQSLRNQVNTIDEELVYLLYRRFEIVKEINTLSKTEDLELFDPDAFIEGILAAF